MNVLAVLYILVALIFFIFTFQEGQRKHLPWGWYRLGGLLMALAWPAALVAAYVSTRGNGSEGDRSDRRDGA